MAGQYRLYGDLITTLDGGVSLTAPCRSDATIVNPTFVADLDGHIEPWSLIQSYKVVDSATTGDRQFSARGNTHQNVAANSIVSLNGSVQRC